MLKVSRVEDTLKEIRKWVLGGESIKERELRTAFLYWVSSQGSIEDLYKYILDPETGKPLEVNPWWDKQSWEEEPAGE